MSFISSSKREFPPFSVSGANRIEGYVPFRNVSSYLKACSGRFKETHDLLTRCGYSRKKSYDKFLRHQSDWNGLKRSIPLRYLAVIGAELPEIERNVEADNREYESFLKLPFFPKNAVVKLMPTVYTEYKLEPSTPEDKAVEIMKAYSKEKCFRVCINYPGVKSIWVLPTGEVHNSFFFPKVTAWERLSWDSYLDSGFRYRSFSITNRTEPK